MHKLWITFSFKIQHHLMKSFVSRIQSTNVFFQGKQKSRSKWLHIEGYQEIHLKSNDLGARCFQVPKYILFGVGQKPY